MLEFDLCSASYRASCSLTGSVQHCFILTLIKRMIAKMWRVHTNHTLITYISMYLDIWDPFGQLTSDGATVLWAVGKETLSWMVYFLSCFFQEFVFFNLSFIFWQLQLSVALCSRNLFSHPLPRMYERWIQGLKQPGLPLSLQWSPYDLSSADEQTFCGINNHKLYLGKCPCFWLSHQHNKADILQDDPILCTFHKAVFHSDKNACAFFSWTNFEFLVQSKHCYPFFPVPHPSLETTL